MAHPNHIFASQDDVWLEADNDENLRAIRAFHPNDNKLALNLEENFNDKNLLQISEALSHSFERWKLTNVW